MHNIVVIFITIFSFFVIIKYEFVNVKLQNSLKYDFMFSDFSLVNISKDRVTLELKSSFGVVSDNKFDTKNTVLSINDKKTTHYIEAKNIKYQNNILSMNKNVTYKSDNVFLWSKYMQYDLLDKKFNSRDSFLVIKGNKKTQYAKADSIKYQNSIISMDKNVTYQSEDILISSDKIKYDLLKAKIYSQMAVVKIKDSVLKSSEMIFDVQTKFLDAENVQVLLDTDDAEYFQDISLKTTNQR